MSRKRKKQLTYFTIAMLFLLTGVEYAVILPTLYLYLQSFGASAMYLGLTLSAFSFSGLFSGPIIGRISDRTRKTKYVLLFANMWEIGGNILYFLGISPFYILLARLVAGVGSGVGAAVTADIARSTRVDERTSVLSLVMICRQFGLILGPSCNLFLVLCDFHIGPVHVTALSSPGIFMAILWVLLEVLILFCYFDLPALYHDENIEQNIQYSTSTTCPGSEHPDAVTTNHQTNLNINTDERTPILRVSRSFNEIPNGLENGRNSYGSLDQVQRTDFSDIKYIDCHIAAHRSSFEIPRGDEDTIIESAERFMGTSTSSESGGDDVTVNHDNVRTLDSVVARTRRSKSATSSPAVTRKTLVPSLSTTASSQNGGRIGDYDVTDDVVVRDGSTSCQRSGNYYINEYCREEVVVILYSAFAALVNQTGLEAMLTPLTQRYLGWRELENSYLFLGAGIEIIVMFVIVHFASKRASDVTLITIGYSLIVISTSVLLYYLPSAPLNDQSNLAAFLFCVMTNVAGLPFVFVCTVSLFSKVTREETQGLSQGLRRTFMGIGTILGPLWTGALIDSLNLMIGVLLGVIGLALVLVILSFNHLRRIDNSRRVANG